MQQSLLWQKLERFQFNQDGVSITFSDKLAKENGWSADFTKRAIFEYRRFLFLLAQREQIISPSHAVDQVWHLHLTHTKSYWNDLCDGVLGFKLHHVPSTGGSKEFAKHKNLYRESLAAYHRVFDEDAPADIWPTVDKQFSGERYVRLNRSKVWIINKFDLTPIKTAFLAGLFLLVPTGPIIGADENTVSNSPSLVPLAFLILFVVIILINRDDGGTGGGSGGRGGSGCGGGCGGCGGD